MLPKIHFGKKTIQRIVKFNDNCYYPLVLDNDWNIHRLFGLSYGLPKNNSINIGWRPSESKLDKIDLFAILFKNGIRDVHYFHSVDTNETHVVKFKVNTDFTLASFYVFDIQSGEKLCNHMEYYRIPFFSIGFILNQKNESLMNQGIEVYVGESDFQFGNN